ncbi:MAG: hypothetical protein FWG75_01760 [Cystobacterineae bacterium]|nr:hypothetical protein [Cystobacterineae bacterium]
MINAIPMLIQKLEKRALPVVVLVAAKDKKTIPIILTMAAALETLIGAAAHAAVRQGGHSFADGHHPCSRGGAATRGRLVAPPP